MSTNRANRPGEGGDYSRRSPSSRGGRGDGGWSPGTFSPAVFIVAGLVILLLAGAAALGRRGVATGPTATPLARGGQPTPPIAAVPGGGQSAPTTTATLGGGEQVLTATAVGRRQQDATAAAGATGRVLVVGNTGGAGVYLRRTPRLDDRDTAYRDGTRLEQIGDDTTADGITWHHVRAPDGKTGWVPAQFTLESR